MNGKWIAILLAACMLLSLMGCVEQRVESTTASTAGTTASTTETTVSTEPVHTTAVPETTGQNAEVVNPYDSKPVELRITYQDYAYRYTGRDLDWEEDVVYLAANLLKNHPALQDIYVYVQSFKGSYWANKNPHYNRELRIAVIEAVDQLLEQIPQLEDYQITMEMARIVALLKDAHSYMGVNAAEVFPISVEYMEKAGQLGFYVVRAPRAREDLLFCQLTAINDVPVEDVIDLLRPYASSENVYWQTANIAEQHFGSLLINLYALRVVGVVDATSNSAVFSFVDHDGNAFTAEIYAVLYAYAASRTIQKDYYANKIGLHARQEEENYWFEVWPEKKTVYFRIVSCIEMADYSVEDCCKDVLAALEAAGEPMRLIVDLRHNGGGYYPLKGMLELMLAVNEMDMDGVYVLVDSESLSATTYMTLQFKTNARDVVFIGAPLGQPQGFFAGAATYWLPNCGLVLRISSMYTDRVPEYTGMTFEPDVLCYPNWEDYVNGVDTVLDTALKMDR